MTSYTHDQENLCEDMGEYSEGLMEHQELVDTQELDSNKQEIRKSIQALIGSRQVCAGELQFSTPWVLRKAIEKEHSNIWIHACEEVPESSVPFKANNISSHTVCKVKEDAEGV